MSILEPKPQTQAGLDAAVTAKINDTNSAARGALNAAYAKVIGVPDGSTAAQIQAIINNAPEGSLIWFGPSQFFLETQILIPKSLTLRGSLGLNNNTSSGTRFTMAAGVQATVDGAVKITGSYVTFQGITVEGAGYTNGSSGIRVQGVGSVHAHGVTIRDCLIRQFGTGITMGINSDHVNTYDTKIAGNNDGVNFELNNMFDYGFFGCLLDGNVRASVHLNSNVSVANVSLIRCHLGFSQYGILQDATTNGNGFTGLTLIDSPIESASVQGALIVNGGYISVKGGYSIWTGTPANAWFEVANLNSGPLWFDQRLEVNSPNPNSPAVVAITGYTNHPVHIDGPLNGFAQARYTSTGLQKNIFLDGLPAGGTAAPAAGTWAVGDRIRNTAPVANGPTGWVCVTAGSPGVWQAEATLGNPAKASGTTADSVLSLGTNSGYINPSSRSKLRFGADAANLYADYDGGAGGVRFRDGNNSYANTATIHAGGLELSTTGVLRSGRAATGSRPTAAPAGAGAMFYDTTLSKPIWSDGTNWKDATGAIV